LQGTPGCYARSSFPFAANTRWRDSPLFHYQALARPGEVRLLYDSQRKLCSVLWGAIEGAAERYGEQVHIVERSCMKRGASVCPIEAQFSDPLDDASPLPHIPERVAREAQQLELRRLVLALLPGYGTTDGATLGGLQERLLRCTSTATDGALRGCAAAAIRRTHEKQRQPARK
jgi:hypothetical protein